MTLVNTSINPIRVAELAVASNKKIKIGFIDSEAKATQNDTWTIENATEILAAYGTDDSTGIHEEFTISGNVLTLTNASTGTATGFIIFK